MSMVTVNHVFYQSGYLKGICKSGSQQGRLLLIAVFKKYQFKHFGSNGISKKYTGYNGY
jgi:hypothetical protein